MGKIYRVVLNSNIANGGLNNQQRYFYDWDKLEQGQYRCSFTYIGAINGNPDLFFIPIVLIDLGQSTTYFAIGTNTLTNTAIPNYLGYVEHNVITYNPIDTRPNNAYIFADLETNPPIYLQQRPTNNTFLVNIVTNSNPPSNYNSALIGRYTLTLFLEKMD